MFRCATQSLQSFPLDTFPLPAEAKQCRFWPSFPESRPRKVRRCRVRPTSPEEQAGKVRRCRFWPTSPESCPGKVRRCRFQLRPPESCPEKVRRCRFQLRPPENCPGKSGGAGFGQRPRRGRRPAGRFRRPPESILLPAEDDKSRRNRGQYNHDVLNLFGKSANLVVFEFVGLPGNLKLTGLRVNSRSL